MLSSAFISVRSRQHSALLWITGAIYSSLVLTCALRHEAWFDEAQSWLLARDATLKELLAVYSRYEGTPALWQVVLMPFAKLGFPYDDLSTISAALAITGVALFLWRAPFPLWMKVLFPFCYFPLFQYAVIARSYALFPPLLWGIAILFPRRTTSQALPYFALLALLANASLHGALIAAVLFVEWFWSAWRGGLFSRRPRLAWTIVAVFSLLYFLLLLELRLPPDIVDRSAGAHGPNAIAVRILKQISEAFWGGLGSNAYHAFSTLVGALVIVGSLIWFRQTTARYVFAGLLIPLLLLAGWKQAAGWHAGLIFLGWIFSLWIFFAEHREIASRYKALQFLIGAVLVAQAFFGMRSIWFDIWNNYSGSKAAAAYLHETGEARQKLYAIGFKSFAIQPYFHRNLFAQQENERSPAFYSWKQSLDHERFSDLTAQQPDLVIVGNDGSSDTSELEAIHSLGYCEQRRFTGAMWWKNGRAEPDTYVFMARCR